MTEFHKIFQLLKILKNKNKKKNSKNTITHVQGTLDVIILKIMGSQLHISYYIII